jgi:hypothetical protein
VIVPTSNKFYAVRNATTGSQRILIRTSGGTGVTLANGFTQLMYCDGTNVVLASLPINSTTGSVGSLSIDGLVVSANSSTDAVRITQTGSGNALLVEDSANPDATPFVVTADGNVGIGTSTPVGQLQVAGGRALFGPNSEVYAIGVGFNQTRVAAGEVFFVGASNATAPDLVIANASGFERVRVTNAGDVGIGTSPTSTMTLYNATSSILRVEGDAQSAVQVRLYSNNAQSPAQTFFKYRGTLASPAAVQTGDVAGAIGWNVFGGTNVRQIGAITTGVESFVSDANISGALIFSAASAGTLTERLRIASAGQIGIGGTNYGTSGQVLTSNGAAAAPSWQTPGGITNGLLLNVQTFISSGTYTPTSGMTRIVVILVGGGGGGGGSAGTGGNGGTTSLGSLVSAFGGSGGISSVNLSNGGGAGGNGGTNTQIFIPGQGGGSGVSLVGSQGVGGQGGGPGGARSVVDTAGVNGFRGGGGSGAGISGGCTPGRGLGGGGQGTTVINYITSGIGASQTVTIGSGGTAGTGTPAGGAGGAGYVIIYEYS